VNLRHDQHPAAPARGGGHGRVYAGQTAADREEGRRTRLGAAIHDIVGSHGYGALTVERACAKANVSTRTFYQLYVNKEAAFADCYQSLLQRSGERVVASLVATEGQPMAERIPAAMLAFLQPMFADRRSARIAFVEVVGLSPQIEATRLRTRERLIDLIVSEGTAAAARGEVADRDFRFAALAMIGSTTAVAHDWMLGKERGPLRELERQLAHLAVQLLGATPVEP